MCFARVETGNRKFGLVAFERSLVFEYLNLKNSFCHILIIHLVSRVKVLMLSVNFINTQFLSDFKWISTLFFYINNLSGY